MPRSHGTQIPIIACVAVALVCLILMSSRYSQPQMLCHRTRDVISSFLARNSSASSADAHCKYDPSSDSPCVLVTKCAPGDEGCSNLETISDETREDYRKRYEEATKKTPGAFVFMAFAPWCPHCHDALPEFVKASKAASVPFLLVNAELLPRKFVTDSAKDGGLGVTHFPFIAKVDEAHANTQVFEDLPSEEKLVEFSSKTPMEMLFS